MKLKRLIVLFLGMLGCLVNTALGQMRFFNNTNVHVTFSTIVCTKDESFLYKVLCELPAQSKCSIDFKPTDEHLFFITLKNDKSDSSIVAPLAPYCLINKSIVISASNDEQDDYYLFQTYPHAPQSIGPSSPEPIKSIRLSKRVPNPAIFYNNTESPAVVRQIDPSTGYKIDIFPVEAQTKTYFNNQEKDISIMMFESQTSRRPLWTHNLLIPQEQTMAAGAFILNFTQDGELSAEIQKLRKFTCVLL